MSPGGVQAPGLGYPSSASFIDEEQIRLQANRESDRFTLACVQTLSQQPDCLGVLWLCDVHPGCLCSLDGSGARAS